MQPQNTPQRTSEHFHGNEAKDRHQPIQAHAQTRWLAPQQTPASPQQNPPFPCTCHWQSALSTNPPHAWHEWTINPGSMGFLCNTEVGIWNKILNICHQIIYFSLFHWILKPTVVENRISTRAHPKIHIIWQRLFNISKCVQIHSHVIQRGSDWQESIWRAKKQLGKQIRHAPKYRTWFMSLRSSYSLAVALSSPVIAAVTLVNISSISSGSCGTCPVFWPEQISNIQPPHNRWSKRHPITICRKSMRNAPCYIGSN